MEKTCEICGELFQTSYKHAKYCSNRCRTESKKKPKTCVNCGSIFMSKNKHARFCSSKCGRINHYKDNHVTLMCDGCGKRFDRISSKVRYEHNYCSNECSIKHRIRPTRSQILTCTNCGKEFSRQPHAIRDLYNYCSHDCYAEHVKTAGLIRGENHPNYNHELTKEERKEGRNYPEYYLWRDKVYERDDYTCQKCGIRGKVLNAHHILNYSSHPEKRTDIANGITLCSDCHNEFHRIYSRFDNNDEQIKEFISRDKLIPSRAAGKLAEGVETNGVA